MSRELALSQLTTELTDFLGLPANLGLPPVRKVSCERADNTQWLAEATLDTDFDSAKAWEAIGAWAAYSGGQVELGDAYPSSAQCWPSGTQRTARLTVVVAGVKVCVKAYLDGSFPAPMPEVVTA
ncbi:MAG TPA: hypothetical protein VGS97_02775 [Actinocrinis sp.]|uniref:hypothetical protein n=1 Tax=Actinocrinis sp. TaxID=1920516 RepID=UPI002DDDACEA|nr:hypothetical protein [Actinocrinis sp.]HEV2342995.1 hypothetical protein [Actinocrinis sp.]